MKGARSTTLSSSILAQANIREKHPWHKAIFLYSLFTTDSNANISKKGMNNLLTYRRRSKRIHLFCFVDSLFVADECPSISDGQA